MLDSSIFAQNEYAVEEGMYVGLSVSGFNWTAGSVEFNDGYVCNLGDDTGIDVTLGHRISQWLSLQIDVTLYPRLHPSTSDAWAEDGSHRIRAPDRVTNEDGGFLSVSLLLHKPWGQVLPYIGGGAGAMEVPCRGDRGGTEIGFIWEAQAGVQFFSYEMPRYPLT
jgi:opacity protein-like surface antigen